MKRPLLWALLAYAGAWLGVYTLARDGAWLHVALLAFAAGWTFSRVWYLEQACKRWTPGRESNSRA